MPALQTLLSKGQRDALGGDAQARLFEHFHLAVDTGRDLPVAALGALAEGLDAGSGWWLRVDPVHMVADRDQLYLSACETLALAQSEADALVAELNTLYADEGWQFIAVAPQRWYLRLPRALSMKTVSTAAAMGQRVGAVLPSGKDALTWQRVMTEIQMLLHSSPVNARRSEEGRLVVNSLWFWGGGALPGGTCACDFDAVVAADPLSQGLAKLCKLTYREDGPGLLSQDELPAHTLWHSAFDDAARLEQEVLAPLLALLRKGHLARLDIEMPGFGRWRVGPKALRRWWRRVKPLASLLGGPR